MFHVEQLAQPTPTDAKARRLVRLPDGRTGRLVWCPAPTRRDRTQAKVLVAGRHLWVPAAGLQLLPATCPTCGSDQVNHQEPAHYFRTGRECHDDFHGEADGG